jgi:hypothetical protein
VKLQEAIENLKSIVKFSAVKGQKHLDLTLVEASKREVFERYLVVVQNAVKAGELTEDELKEKLGLV